MVVCSQVDKESGKCLLCFQDGTEFWVLLRDLQHGRFNYIIHSLLIFVYICFDLYNYKYVVDDNLLLLCVMLRVSM